MDWRRISLVLALYCAVASGQRGGRRYVPDQPLEESLSVENHRFRTKSRVDGAEDVRRGESRRITTETPTGDSQRVHSRVRGRTDESRQFHSIPPRESQTAKDDGRKLQPRRNQETERRKFTSREEVQSERFKPRETSEPVVSNNQNVGRGRIRNSEEGRKSVTRLSNRAHEDTEIQGARHEPVRNRAGETRRGRLEQSSRNQASTRISSQEETRSLQRPTQSHPPTERISLTPDQSSPRNDETLENTQTLNGASGYTTSGPDLTAKISEVSDISQELSPDGATDSRVNGLDNQGHLTEGLFTDYGSTAGKSAVIDSTKSTLRPTISTENTIEYPTKLNDVEESRRTSKKLDVDVTERTQVRGRGRATEEAPRRRVPEVSVRSRGDSSESRNSQPHVTRGRSRSSEETGRSRQVDSSRNVRLEGSGRARGRSSEEFKDDTNRNARLEVKARRKSSEEVSRTRNSEEVVRTVDDRVRSHTNDRSKNNIEDAGRVNQPEQRTRSRTAEVRSRNPQVDDKRSGDSSRSRQDSPSTRGRTKDIPSRGTAETRTSIKNSAKLLDTEVTSHTRSNDFANFRSRAKQEHPTKSPAVERLAEAAPIVDSSLLEPTEAGALKTPSDYRIEEKNEVTIGSPSDGHVTPAIKPIGRGSGRKQTFRERGPAKGPKLHKESEHSGEVRDEDNYPEVYKQLKKSGTGPKEILVFSPSQK